MKVLGGRKYFEAVGRQAASLGKSWPYITARAGEWAQSAARDGYEHQRRPSWRHALGKSGSDNNGK